MPSAKFMANLYVRRHRSRFLEQSKIWHYETPDYSPLCVCSTKSKWWDGGAPKNGYGMNTTENVKYVTCRRCRKILADRGVELPELIEEETE